MRNKHKPDTAHPGLTLGSALAAAFRLVLAGISVRAAAIGGQAPKRDR